MRHAFFALLLVATAFGQESSFVKDVAPVFANYCYGCHSGAVKMSDLDLETAEGIARGGKGGPVVVPWKADDSRLFLSVTGKLKPAMPMDGRTLAAGEIDAIRKWIESGAKGPTAEDTAAMRAQAAAARNPRIEPRGAVKAQILALAWRPDGKRLALGGYKEVRLAESDGKVSGTLAGHVSAVRAVAFSADGKWLAAAGGLPSQRGEVKIWDVGQGSVARTITGHDDAIYAVAFSPDGKLLATSSYDKLIKLWDTGTGREVRTLKDHIDAVYALAFTPDGRRLVSGAADRTVKVWDVATGERLYTMSEPTDGINSVAVSRDGKLVAAGGLDKTIRVWSLGEKGATLLRSEIAHEDAILRLAFSPDAKMLVSASADRSIKVFRTGDLVEIKSHGGQPDWVFGLEFSPDGRMFAVGRFDGSLTIYSAAQGGPAQVADGR